ncbi:hypothetical protein HUT19_37785 [Streptomyces sp. NA02950]|uniref:hypothetical protein n=1 Tax=Streptomyces sp. NA02950 TaxID=2742137 RepID=UPI0015928D7D|nr:hypothetical protein [Streptomyces sp. NA02950]QKV96742.1 hypothetical protein HUT19_37785 [Streptomyces sp. NA02950]
MRTARDHFGVPVGFGVHDLGPDADAERTSEVWRSWLAGLFAWGGRVAQPCGRLARTVRV